MHFCLLSDIDYCISIHAPREGGDVLFFPLPSQAEHISIHAPREGGDHRADSDARQTHISIHAPREGGDVAGVLICQWHNSISIHAPREGGDYK